MTIYDYMTPFEDEDDRQEHVPPLAPPQPMTKGQAVASPASAGTPRFDNKTTKPCSCRSNNSSSSDPGSTSSSHGGSDVMHAANGLPVDKTCCYVCADIVGTTKHEDSGAQSKMSSNRCQHCHSVLHKRAFPALQTDCYAITETPNCHEHVESPLRNEYNPLEQELNLLEQESTPLKYEASPLEQAARPLEGRDIATAACGTEVGAQQSQPEAGKQESKGRCPTLNARKLPLMGSARLWPSLRPVPFYGKCL
jgi:hypothetical protein